MHSFSKGVFCNISLFPPSCQSPRPIPTKNTQAKLTCSTASGSAAVARKVISERLYIPTTLPSPSTIGTAPIPEITDSKGRLFHQMKTPKITCVEDRIPKQRRQVRAAITDDMVQGEQSRGLRHGHSARARVQHGQSRPIRTSRQNNQSDTNTKSEGREAWDLHSTLLAPPPPTS